MTSFNGPVHPKVIDLLAREQFEQRTPAWYARRKTLMTASDAAAALGVKPFKTYSGDVRADCLKKKVTGAFRGNMFTAHGVRLEDTARDMAAELMGDTIFDVGLIVHPDYPWLGASPDGVTASGRCVEIKCPMKREIVPGRVPSHYIPQIQLQMEVCNLDATLWIEFLPPELAADGKPFISMHVVERDREWFSENKDKLHSFFLEYQAMRETAGPPAALPDVPCMIVGDLYDFL